MVEDATRRADDHVDPDPEAAQLLAHRCSAVDRRYPGEGAVPERDELRGYLQGKLASGHEHEGAYVASRLPEKLGEGDTEGRSLPGTGSGSGDKVRTFFEKARYGEDLYRRGLLESLSRKGGKSRRPESERLERWDIHEVPARKKITHFSTKGGNVLDRH